MKKTMLLFIVLMICFSCNKDSKIERQIATIDVDFTIERFDLAFQEATPKDLPKLKSAYPFMFPRQYKDTFWIDRMADTLQQELLKETTKTFPDLKQERQDIKTLFQHLKFYFPNNFKIPRVVTTTSSVDYRNKVVVTDTIVLISLDTYLGESHKFYQGIQKYLRERFDKSQISIDLAKKYSENYIYQEQKKTLLDEMIYFGKQLYFTEKMLPKKQKNEIIGYTKDDYLWAEKNENQIWRYFLEKELLFSTNSKLPSRFINPAPFSKFYLQEIDSESPGEIGKYMGWQIVKAYMENNDVSLSQMLLKSPEAIFNNSKFKPKR
ncbi:gliding motility lipoprotein GldB [Mangrovimonas spongiae]|uniref:Gliding motility lipoprotein GldB n=2 Tax=Mangrovimonas spongiae TaxID=2494697 RepID=A0A3R9MGM4_9FLAO|nr:gliding motility lipoprotein GldB [Mangrovimonas spongiae]